VPITALHRALTDPGDLALAPIPAGVRDLLEALDAPPRLAAHLRLVHDVARRLTTALAERCPHMVIDIEAVHFGAAIHDIGKVVHPAELSGPGSAHEEAGYELLLRKGFDEDLARFARTHAAWNHADVQVEDLLVSVADKVWKGKRVAGLEQLLVDVLAGATGRSKWETFMELDDVLGQLAADADRRLAFQAAHPLNG
jgi:HD-like signal output (HDOD) protein